ncbi:Hypothetical predicted protein [Pelobates cultripes]|uniref:Uncharacterized protein n=1 Tax=Pelobates cultripes TaxID=61616 RepID=A0AAD1TNE1_PELCU|nr:Hypothetical predicted protein [Pelobates cultripes]
MTHRKVETPSLPRTFFTSFVLESKCQLEDQRYAVQLLKSDLYSSHTSME